MHNFLITAFVVLIGALLAWVIIGSIGAHCVTGTIEPGMVLDRVYKPSSTSIGTDSKGHAVVLSESESFKLILQTNHGVQTITVPAEQWAQAHANQPVEVLYRTFIGIDDYSIASFGAATAER